MLFKYFAFNKILLPVSALFMFFSCSTFKETDIEIIGRKSWNEWKQESKWDLKSYYSTDFKKSNIEILKKHLNENNIKFEIFASSFCDECKEEVPKIIRMLEDSGMADSCLAIIGLDRDYAEPGNSHKSLKIKNLPILVIHQNNINLGALTSPQNDWLSATLDLLNK